MKDSNLQARLREPRSVTGILDELDASLRTGGAGELAPIPTQFRPLDRVLGGGLHPGELFLVGGIPGAGKTILTLQWARNIAAAGRSAIYICYEHEETDLLIRLLALEMGETADAGDLEMEDFRTSILDAAMGGRRGLAEVLEAEQSARRAYERVEGYADRLWLLRASGARTGLAEIEEIVSGRPHDRPVLFLDYLQKVSVHPEPADEAEKVRRIAEALKDLALTYRIPIVSVVAADQEGLRSRRLRLHHLRGSSALAFEADVAILLNEKFNSVSKVHLAYDPLRAETFKRYVVLSLEKNRGGPNLIDLEFRKDFVHFRFDPEGGIVSENLVDERLYTE
jgi:replicative DNA helicase